MRQYKELQRTGPNREFILFVTTITFKLSSVRACVPVVDELWYCERFMRVYMRLFLSYKKIQRSSLVVVCYFLYRVSA